VIIDSANSSHIDDSTKGHVLAPTNFSEMLSGQINHNISSDYVVNVTRGRNKSLKSGSRRKIEVRSTERVEGLSLQLKHIY